jgi:Fe-S cluster biogenesis protein NfuA
MVKRNELDRRARAIEDLVRKLESAGDAGLRATARELVQALMELHGAGLERVMELTDQAGEPGAALIERFARDDIIKHLLVLHGLHPLDLQSRVQQAIDDAGPSLRSQGGHIERVVVDETGTVTVTLRVEGSTHGCGSPSATLKTAVQDAIYGNAPDVSSLIVEMSPSEPEPAAAAFVPIGSVRRRNPDGSIAARSNAEKTGAHP